MAEGNKAKIAKRNLFGKTTHEIKDLNPYQNKHTIKARVTKKGELKSWSNHRGEGQVFDFILKDASGDIKVTAFNEEARKYHKFIEEGNVYFLTNGKIQPIKNQKYNTVSIYIYELKILRPNFLFFSADSN